jgi:predicted RNase H-like HicB family nuclease
MKWKKKGGALRCGEGQAEIRIEELEGQFWVSWKLPSGAWEAGQPFLTLEGAKAAGEQVLGAMIEFESQEKAYFQKRRDYYSERQKKLDSLTPQEKSLKKAFGMYVKMTEMEKAYVRHLNPRIAGIFDKVIAEEAQEGQVGNA